MELLWNNSMRIEINVPGSCRLWWKWYLGFKTGERGSRCEGCTDYGTAPIWWTTVWGDSRGSYLTPILTSRAAPSVMSVRRAGRLSVGVWRVVGYINITDWKGVDGKRDGLPYSGMNLESILILSCLSFLFLHPPSLHMSFSVDDLVSSLSESHISQEANDIAVLQVKHLSDEFLSL